MDEKLKLIIFECITEVLNENVSFSQYDPNKSVRTGEFRKILGLGDRNKGHKKGESPAEQAEEKAAAVADAVDNAKVEAKSDVIDAKVLEKAKYISNNARLPFDVVKDKLFKAYGKEGKVLEDYVSSIHFGLRADRRDLLNFLKDANEAKKELKLRKEKRKAARDAEKEREKQKEKEPEKGEDRGEKANSSVIPQRIRDTMEKKFQHWKATGYINLDSLNIGAPFKIYKYMLPEHYRAIAFDDDGQLVWTWVGSHEEYNDVLGKEVARIRRYLTAKEQVKNRGRLKPDAKPDTKPNIYETETLTKKKFAPLLKPDGTLNV